MFNSSYLAIEIASKNTKLAYGLYEKSGLKVHDYSVFDTPKGAFNNGNLIEPEILSNTIKNTLAKKKIKPHKVIFVISSTNIIVREIMLPKSTDKEVKMLLKHEAQQFLPVELSNYVFDHRVLEDITSKDGVLTRVLLIAIPVSLIDEYIKLSELLDLKVESIDVPVDCIYKLMCNDSNKPLIGIKQSELESNFAMFEIGQTTVNINIFSKGILKINRLLQVGYNEIVSPRIPSLESANIKRPDTIPDNQIKSAVEAANNVFTQINSFIDFYTSANNIGKLQYIYLYGGGSKIEGMDEYAKNFFNIPTNNLEIGKGIFYKGSGSHKDFQDSFALIVNVLGSLVR